MVHWLVLVYLDPQHPYSMRKSNQENFTLCAIYLPRGIICWTLLPWFYLACTWYKGLFLSPLFMGFIVLEGSWVRVHWHCWVDVSGLISLGWQTPQKKKVGPRFHWAGGTFQCCVILCKEPPVPVFKTYFRIRESPVSILWKINQNQRTISYFKSFWEPAVFTKETGGLWAIICFFPKILRTMIYISESGLWFFLRTITCLRTSLITFGVYCLFQCSACKWFSTYMMCKFKSRNEIYLHFM